MIFLRFVLSRLCIYVLQNQGYSGKVTENSYEFVQILHYKSSKYFRANKFAWNYEQ